MTTLSDVGIVNSALISIGENTITSLDQNNRAARTAKRIYEVQRDRTLQRYRWNFAIKRAALAADPTAPAFGYEVRYAVPSDFLSLIGIYDPTEDVRQYTASIDSHKVEGGYILSNSSAPLNIIYIRRVTNPAEFDPSFAELLSYQIAIKLAYALTSGVDQINRIKEEMSEALRMARTTHAFQSTPEVTVASNWLDARLSDGNISGPWRIGPVV